MRIQDLKIGDKIWECELGMNSPLEIISSPERIKDKEGDFIWRCEARPFNDKSAIELACSEKYRAYGPKLYNYPAYSSSGERKKREEEAIKNGWNG